MPIYVYHCPNCYGDFEKIVELKDADKTPVCPTCGGNQSTKKPTSAQLHMRYSPMHPRYMRGQRK